MGPDRMRSFTSHALVMGIFVVATVYGTWPIAKQPGSHVPINLLDSMENAWIFGWIANAIIRNPLGIFHANIFFPEPYALAYAENLLGVAIPVAPVFWLSRNALLVSNIGLLASYAASGFATYLLVRRMSGSMGAGLVAGIAWSLTPNRISQAAHPHVVAWVFIPLLLLLLFRLRQRRSWKDALWIGLVLTLQFWSSFTGGMMAAFLAMGWAAWEVIRLRRRALPMLATAAAGGILGLALTLPLLFPYLQARRLHPEFRHDPTEETVNAASFESYLSPPPWIGPVARPAYRILDDRFGDEPVQWEKWLFPGFWLTGAALASFGAAAVQLARRRRPPWLEPVGFFGLVSLAALMMSLGPSRRGIPLPFLVVSKLVPGSLLRVPARFGAVVLLGMAVVAGLALGALSHRARRLAVGLSLLVLAVEMMPPRITTVEAPPLTAAHRAVARLQGPVLALPTTEFTTAGEIVPYSEFRDTQHMYLSTANFRPLVNGYAAFLPEGYWEVVVAVQEFPSNEGLAILHKRGVDTVVVQTELVKGTRWEGVAERLELWPGARLFSAGKGVRVYDISGAEMQPATSAAGRTSEVTS